MKDPHMEDVLADPTYWTFNDPKWQTERTGMKDVINQLTAMIITLAVGIVFIAVAMVIYRTTQDNNDRLLQQEKICLKAGGQWIKSDCVNNLIQLHA